MVAIGCGPYRDQMLVRGESISALIDTGPAIIRGEGAHLDRESTYITFVDIRVSSPTAVEEFRDLRRNLHRHYNTRTTTASLDMRDHFTVEPEYGASITMPLPAANWTCSGPRALNELAGNTRSPGRTSVGETRTPL